ncbi:MAG: lipocalin family protein [Pseudomonadota bacterium]
MMRIRRLNYSGWLLCPAVVASMMALSLTARAFSNQSEVKLPQYLGVWFEHARTTNQFQDNTLQRDGKEFGPCFAARTNYTADGDNAIKVQNACKRRAPDGSVITDRVTGKAVLQAGTQGRKLQIAFGSGIARFFQRAISGGGFAYWIYCIGPVNSSGLYDWAVVSGPEKDYVFVVTRQRSISEKVQAEILRCSRASALPVDKLIYRQSDQAR